MAKVITIASQKGGVGYEKYDLCESGHWADQEGKKRPFDWCGCPGQYDSVSGDRGTRWSGCYLGELDVFGVSPYGDDDLIKCLNTMDNVVVYVYNKENNVGTTVWERALVCPHVIKDSKEL